MKNTYLKCGDCDYETDLLLERKFACPECGGLYDVEHRFLNIDAATRRHTFDRRAVPKTSIMHRSGVWRFGGTTGILMPYILPEQMISLGEGMHPFVPGGKALRKWIGGNLDLYFLLEGINPTGSFKDNGMTVAVTDASIAGVKALICRSTGDTSAAAAAYAARAGIPCITLLPRNQGITPSQIVQPLAHNSVVITYPGTFDDIKDAYNELVLSGEYYPVNSINPARIEGHTATVYITAQFLGWELPDWFAVPVGNGSNSTSVGIGMRRLLETGLAQKPARILGVQAHSASPLYDAWVGSRNNKEWLAKYVSLTGVGNTAATAQNIGNPASHKKVIREIGGFRETEGCSGAMEKAEEGDLRAGMFVAGADGIEVCPQTGVVIAGVRNAVRKGIIKNGQRVVIVSTAHLLKFVHVVEEERGSMIREINDCRAESMLDSNC